MQSCSCWDCVWVDLCSLPVYLHSYLSSPHCPHTSVNVGFRVRGCPGLKALGFQCKGGLSLRACLLRCGGGVLEALGQDCTLGVSLLSKFTVFPGCPCLQDGRGVALGGGEAAGALCPSQTRGVFPVHISKSALGQRPAMVQDEF